MQFENKKYPHTMKDKLFSFQKTRNTCSSVLLLCVHLFCTIRQFVFNTKEDLVPRAKSFVKSTGRLMVLLAIEPEK